MRPTARRAATERQPDGRRDDLALRFRQGLLRRTIQGLAEDFCTPPQEIAEHVACVRLALPDGNHATELLSECERNAAVRRRGLQVPA
jgi:hypothetical protein